MFHKVHRFEKNVINKSMLHKNSIYLFYFLLTISHVSTPTVCNIPRDNNLISRFAINSLYAWYYFVVVTKNGHLGLVTSFCGVLWSHNSIGKRTNLKKFRTEERNSKRHSEINKNDKKVIIVNFTGRVTACPESGGGKYCFSLLNRRVYR